MHLVIGLLFHIICDINKILSADKRHPNKLKQKLHTQFQVG